MKTNFKEPLFFQEYIPSILATRWLGNQKKLVVPNMIPSPISIAPSEQDSEGVTTEPHFLEVLMFAATVPLKLNISLVWSQVCGFIP